MKLDGLAVYGLFVLGLFPVTQGSLRRGGSRSGEGSAAHLTVGDRTEARAFQAVNTANISSCGPLAKYPNARPKNYKDSQVTKYDTQAKKTIKVTFSAGDIIPFECVPGFTTNGAKDGGTTFNVNCNELGYYKPSGVCLKASKCGPVPNISHAIPTGKTPGDSVKFSCASGYSLDGEQVVAGGLGKNQFFELKCVEFSGEYEAFTGECKPYAFVPATETVRVYNKVFEALFIVSCKGTLKKAFGAGEVPTGLDAACSKIQDSALQAECGKLVTQIKSDFQTQLAARQAHDKASNKSWYEAEDPARPGIGSHAQAFCSSLWQLLEMPSQ